MVARTFCVFCLLKNSWNMRTSSIANCQSRADSTCGFPFSRMQSFWSSLRKLRARLLPYYSAYSIFVNDAYQAQSVQSTNAAQKGPARDKVSIPRRRHPLTHTRVYHLHTLKHVKLNQSLTRMVCDAIYVIPSRQRKKDPNKSLDAAIQRRRHNLSVFLPPSQQAQHTPPASPGSTFPAPNPKYRRNSRNGTISERAASSESERE